MGTMEIAGGTCAVCGQKIVFAEDGKRCSNCGIVVHGACDAQGTCSRCGRAYQVYERPPADPLRGAIVPRSLRPSSPAGPVIVIVIVALLFMLVIGFLVMFLRGL